MSDKFPRGSSHAHNYAILEIILKIGGDPNQ